MNRTAGNRIWVAATLAAVLLCVLSGPFGTGVLPVPTRTLVWGTLIGVNALKWWAWYRWIAPRVPAGVWPDIAVAGAGALVLNATLPLEIAFVYRAVGLDFRFGWAGVWLSAVVIAVAISVLTAVVAGRAPEPDPGEQQVRTAPQVTDVPRGLALKVDLSTVMAMTAEDHYLRLHLAGGDRPLILYRFGDALADMAGVDGLQVHRSAWVAAHAVAGADRKGRRWWLRLVDGTRLPVSDRHLPAVRARGWLECKPP